MDKPASFALYREELEDTLRDLLDDGWPPLLYRMMRYHLGWEDADGNPTSGRGKTLRPALCLLACEAVGGNWRTALPAAAGVELVHNFSLIHDDIQDQDRERRHRPTVWSLWGRAQAINAGDSMFSLARLSLLRLSEYGSDSGTVIEAARVLDAAALEMIEGQCLDLSFEDQLDIGLDTYLKMISKKTGALFGCSLRLGALAGGGDPEVVEGLDQFGRRLGIAFQVKDDMLGIWGMEVHMGKPLANDIRRRKKSLPIVYALANSEGEMRERLIEVYNRPSLDEDDVSDVLAGLESLGASEYCYRTAKDRRDKALAELDMLDISGKACDELRQVAGFLLEREF